MKAIRYIPFHSRPSCDCCVSLHFVTNVFIRLNVAWVSVLSSNCFTTILSGGLAAGIFALLTRWYITWLSAKFLPNHNVLAIQYWPISVLLGISSRIYGYWTNPDPYWRSGLQGHSRNYADLFDYWILLHHYQSGAGIGNVWRKKKNLWHSYLSIGSFIFT